MNNRTPNGHPTDGAAASAFFSDHPCREITVAGQLRDLTEETLQALRQTNHPPALFVRSGQLVRIIRDERGHHVISPVSESALRGYRARSANHVKVTRRGDVVDCPPPIDVVRDILTLPPMRWKFPPLLGVTETPVIRR